MISLSGKDSSLLSYRSPPETLRLVSAVQFPMPSGIAKRQKRNNRCIAHTFRERLHVAVFQAELGQSGDLGEDGVGLIFLG